MYVYFLDRPGPACLLYLRLKLLTRYGMDVSHYILESAAFTRATLAGRWTRWLSIVLLGLPWMLLVSVAESSRILEGTTIHWKLIPWHEMGLLILTGILCNFILSGYIVRLLEGAAVPPEFDNWPRLCLDGMKVQVIPLVWILVPSILAFIEYDISSGGLLPASQWGSMPGTILIILLLVTQLVILFIAAQYVFIGAIRFARTGSLREAFVVLEIRKTLSRIGLLNYFLGLGLITLLWLVFNFVLVQFSQVPYAGPVIALALGPFLTVFCVRFIAHSCDAEFSPAGGESGAPRNAAVPARVLIPEMFAWGIVLSILFILCFTPLALVIGSASRFTPW